MESMFLFIKNLFFFHFSFKCLVGRSGFYTQPVYDKKNSQLQPALRLKMTNICEYSARGGLIR